MSIGKISVAVLWIALAGAFLAPDGSTYAEWGRFFFWLTLAAHVVECAIFFGKAKASKGALGSNLALIFVFGVAHVMELEPA
ncbi:MAG: hypothetical protein ACI8TX_002209 [Hyphomicrobiaceae bacterium]|jgi:uncharacterized protein YhhL (DUF1145 family)